MAATYICVCVGEKRKRRSTRAMSREDVGEKVGERR